MSPAVTRAWGFQQHAASGMIRTYGKDRPELLVGPTVDRLSMRGRQAAECLKKALGTDARQPWESDPFELLGTALMDGTPQGKKASDFKVKSSC